MSGPHLLVQQPWALHDKFAQLLSEWAVLKGYPTHPLNRCFVAFAEQVTASRATISRLVNQPGEGATPRKFFLERICSTLGTDENLDRLPVEPSLPKPTQPSLGLEEVAALVVPQENPTLELEEPLAAHDGFTPVAGAVYEVRRKDGGLVRVISVSALSVRYLRVNTQGESQNPTETFDQSLKTFTAQVLPTPVGVFSIPEGFAPPVEDADFQTPVEGVQTTAYVIANVQLSQLGLAGNRAARIIMEQLGAWESPEDVVLPLCVQTITGGPKVVQRVALPFGQGMVTVPAAARATLTTLEPFDACQSALTTMQRIASAYRVRLDQKVVAQAVQQDVLLPLREAAEPMIKAVDELALVQTAFEDLEVPTGSPELAKFIQRKTGKLREIRRTLSRSLRPFRAE